MKRIVICAATFIGCCIISINLSAQQVFTLDECRQMAIENNVAIKNSKIDAEISALTKNQAFTAYFPTVSATGMTFKANEPMIHKDVDISQIQGLLQVMGLPATILGAIPSSIPIDLMEKGTVGMVSAVQPLFAGGQIYNSNKLARVGADVSNLRVKLSENDVVVNTENYFWQIVSLEEKLKTISTVNAQLDRISSDVSVAVDAGIATRNDMLKVELQQQTMESNRIKVENGIKIYKILLRQQIGAENTDFDIEYDKSLAPANPVEYYVDAETCLDQRTESALLDKSIEAATLQKKIEVGKNLPTIGVGAAYMYHNLVEDDTDLGMVFGVISVPISSWWGGSYAIKQSELSRQKAENTRQESRQLLIVDIESKWNELQQAYLQVNVAEKTIESATENLRLNEDYYNAGTVALSDLLDAQTLYQQGSDSYSEAFIQYRQALTKYLQATGR